MNVALDRGLVHSTNRDAMRRIRAAARRGWSCRLPAGTVMVIAADLDAWRARGLDPGAERRIRLAGAGCCGVRLSVDECRDIVRAEAAR